MDREPVKVHLSPEDQKGMNITVNESVQRFPCQQSVPLQGLREITWKLPRFCREATARGTNGNRSVFKSYFIYQPKKTPKNCGVLTVFGHKVRGCPANVLLLHPSAWPMLFPHFEIKVEVRLPPFFTCFPVC